MQIVFSDDAVSNKDYITLIVGNLMNQDDGSFRYVEFIRIYLFTNQTERFV